MRDGLSVGDTAELVWSVQSEHVIALGEPEFKRLTSSARAIVFSTPNMIMLMERTARKLLAPWLESHEESVGASISVEHLAPTPIGATVRGVATVTKIEGRVIEFDVVAFDESEMIGRGTHRRAIVTLERLSQRVDAKSTLISDPPRDSSQRKGNTGQLPKLETLHVHWDGPVVRVRLNRPEKLNAVNVQMTSDWEALNDWLAGNPQLRVVVLSGNGKAFCAGDDVPEVGTLSIDEARELSFRQARMYLSWESLPQVFLAAIHGYALGGGCVMACACDFRIGTYGASFGMPEVLLGWPPGYGIAQLISLIGKARALEMCLLGNPLSAAQAAQLGLLTELVPKQQLDDAVERFVSKLLALPGDAMVATKRLVHRDEGLQPKSAYLADTAEYIRCLGLPAARQGIRGFVDKPKSH